MAARPLRDGHADLAEADDAERPAAQLDARELRRASTRRGASTRRPPAIVRASAVEQRDRVLGRRDRVAGRRVDDRDPGPRRGLEVDVVDADPGPADDDCSRVPAAISSASTWTWLRTTSASYSPQDRRAAPSRRRPMRTSTSWWAPQQLDALGRDGLGDEDPHAPARRDGRLRCPSRRERGAAAPRRPPRPARPPGPARARPPRSSPIASRISSTVTEPRWPSRKILPVSLPWPPASTRPRALELAVERLPVEAVGDARGGHRLRGDARRPRTARTRAPRARPASPRRTPRGGRTRRRPSACISRRPSSTWKTTAIAGVHGVSPSAAASRCARRSR